MRALLTSVLLAGICGAPAAMGQTIDGNVVGAVFDPSGASIGNASVELVNAATGVKATARSSSDGAYRFSNVLIGTYAVTVTAPNFTSSSLKDVEVELNKTTTANITLQVGAVTAAVNVTDAVVLLDTTTAQISSEYPARLAADLAVANDPAGGVLNLALLGAGVASAGGVGAGTGPSVGGQRPRNNNFTVEGVDNNRKDVTGPTVLIPNDGVAEFTVLQNQFSAEFGRSAGGQFNVAIKNGTNELHGSLYEYLQNRNLDAVDQAFARQGYTSNQRYDQNRLGAGVGGPIVRNRLFYYGLGEYNPIGFASTVSQATYAPTAEGYATLAKIPGVSQTNLEVLKKFAGTAPQASPYPEPVAGVNIANGIVPISVPTYYNYYNWLGSVDYTISEKDQLRGRYASNRYSVIDTAANLPAFYDPRLTTASIASISEFHTFRPNLLNEFRLAYNRFNDNIQVPNISYPGLSAFPNIVIRDLALQIGPNTNAPNATIQNTYQLIDNASWIKGKHEFKFGVDLRDLIAGSTFIANQRGDYQYSTLEPFVLDYQPDVRAQRSVGTKPYSGNTTAFYAFVNDNWKYSRNLSLNFGLRYEYNGVSQSMKEFALNSVADVPGVISFFAPQAQKLNFAPRIGFAYSPGAKATTSIRAGFGLGYDPWFDNIGQNDRPPQSTSNLLLPAPATNVPGFLAQGGISPAALPPNPTLAQIRANTTAWLPNQTLGYAMTWNLGIQHEFAKDYSLEVRYVGTKGVHLLEQVQINRNSLVTAANFLPTFLARPSQATLDSLPVTLAQLKLVPSNPLAQYGFTSSITAHEPVGNSSYHGLATELKKRFARRLLFDAAYTWSHAMDDSTAETNTSMLSPRRAQDFNNLRSEWASSALDHRHRLTGTWLYDTPWFDKSANRLLRNALGSYQLSGTYIVESPEYVTPQSGLDSNLNSDSVGDRTVVNLAGLPGTSSAVTALKNSAGATVAYVANNPNAQYITAGSGALATGGRNTLATPRINNWNATVAKSFALRERAKLQFRADFFNTFNHPQYTAGRPDSVRLTDRSSNTGYLTPGNPLFGQWDQVFSSNSRTIQVGAKITF